MPIWLRNFVYKEINLFYEKEREEIEKSSGKDKITASTDVKSIKPIPQVQVPNFVTSVKRPKK
jgi:hypothetical protein